MRPRRDGAALGLVKNEPFHPFEPDDSVEQLLELSGNGPYILADLLEGCLRYLRQVQDARSALAQLPTDDVRQAIARRHHLMTDTGDQR